MIEQNACQHSPSFIQDDPYLCASIERHLSIKDTSQKLSPELIKFLDKLSSPKVYPSYLDPQYTQSSYTYPKEEQDGFTRNGSTNATDD